MNDKVAIRERVTHLKMDQTSCARARPSFSRDENGIRLERSLCAPLTPLTFSFDTADILYERDVWKVRGDADQSWGRRRAYFMGRVSWKMVGSMQVANGEPNAEG